MALCIFGAGMDGGLEVFRDGCAQALHSALRWQHSTFSGFLLGKRRNSLLQRPVGGWRLCLAGAGWLAGRGAARREREERGLAARDVQGRRSEEEEGEAQSYDMCFSRYQHGMSSKFKEGYCCYRLAFLQEQAFDFTNRIRFEKRVAA